MHIHTLGWRPSGSWRSCRPRGPGTPCTCTCPIWRRTRRPWGWGATGRRAASRGSPGRARTRRCRWARTRAAALRSTAEGTWGLLRVWFSRGMPLHRQGRGVLLSLSSSFVVVVAVFYLPFFNFWKSNWTLKRVCVIIIITIIMFIYLFYCFLSRGISNKRIIKN